MRGLSNFLSGPSCFWKGIHYLPGVNLRLDHSACSPPPTHKSGVFLSDFAEVWVAWRLQGDFRAAWDMRDGDTTNDNGGLFPEPRNKQILFLTY